MTHLPFMLLLGMFVPLIYVCESRKIIYADTITYPEKRIEADDSGKHAMV